MEQTHSEPRVIKNGGVHIKFAVNKDPSVHGVFPDFCRVSDLPKGKAVIKLESLFRLKMLAPRSPAAVGVR